MATHEKTKSPRSKKEHAEKLRRLMTFLGASLVLLTFLAKDYYRDRAKDANDAAEATLAKSELRRQISDVYVRLAYVQEANDERLQAVQSFLAKQFMNVKGATTGLNPQVIPAVNQYLLASETAKSVARSVTSFEPKYADT